MQISSNDIQDTHTTRFVVASLVVIGSVLATAAVVRTALSAVELVGAPGPASFVEVVTALTWVATSLVLVWLGLALALEMLSFVPGLVGDRAAAAARRVSPFVVRRAVALVLGAGLTSGAAVPAHALGPGDRVTHWGAPAAGSLLTALPDPAFTPSSTVAVAPAPGWTAPRPVVRPQPSTGLLVRPTRAATTAAEGGVVVRRGDSLWSIVSAQLGPGATDAEIAMEWPRWHEANRAVIGTDPDVLRPGQILTAPDGSAR